MMQTKEREGSWWTRCPEAVRVILLNSEKQIKIIETPRDGMQGLNTIIPTRKKIEYINLLLQSGFDTVEVGSFVSPRTIPQMADTTEVLEKLDYTKTK